MAPQAPIDLSPATTPTQVHGMLEFPMTTWRVGGVNVPCCGGGYLRIFPEWILHRGILGNVYGLHELEGQVLHAEKLATLGQLAAGIVHEINNPLTSISVYGEYLLSKLTGSGAEDADVQRVERILRSSDRIMSFTRNLLTYARPSKEEAHPLQVNEVLDEAIEFCEHTIREARVSIVRDYASDLPKVNAVPGQLHQVFVNLITNACNAAHDEGGEVELRTMLHGRDRVLVCVEDNGVGIGDDDLQRVFEPFFSTRRRGKGTGLGLPIVRNIIEQHRGAIEIESAVGGGTRVSVELPCLDS